MDIDWLTKNNLSDQEFASKFILPAYYPVAAHGNMRFSIQTQDEQLIICSDDYAKARGLKDFADSIFKFPDKDFRRFSSAGNFEFNVHMEYLKKHRTSSNYVYKDEKSASMFMTICEPIINFAGEVIGRKDVDSKLAILSNRGIIEQHFKRFDVNIASLDNITNITLTQQEEVILFMLIGGYTQQEIAQLIEISRGMVYKIIAEKLCPKFGLSIISSKLLVEKAISLGFAYFIPECFLASINL